MGVSVCPLWNSPLTSALASDATTCFRVLNYVCIVPFVGVRRFGDFYRSVGSELRS